MDTVFRKKCNTLYKNVGQTFYLSKSFYNIKDKRAKTIHQAILVVIIATN